MIVVLLFDDKNHCKTLDHGYNELNQDVNCFELVDDFVFGIEESCFNIEATAIAVLFGLTLEDQIQR